MVESVTNYPRSARMRAIGYCETAGHDGSRITVIHAETPVVAEAGWIVNLRVLVPSKLVEYATGPCRVIFASGPVLVLESQQ